MIRQTILGHLTTLLLGGLIYILFRQETLQMFGWFDSLNLLGIISELRELTIPVKKYLPEWFIYSLPDGLWVFSYVSGLMLVWDNHINKSNFFWIILIPFLALSSEFFQLFNLIPGTFDLIDMTFYLIGAVLPIIIFKPK